MLAVGSGREVPRHEQEVGREVKVRKALEIKGKGGRKKCYSRVTV
jgi:hypothetical protein